MAARPQLSPGSKKESEDERSYSRRALQRLLRTLSAAHCPLACSHSRSRLLVVDPRTPGGFWPVTFTYTGLTFSARFSCNSRAVALGIGRAVTTRRDIHTWGGSQMSRKRAEPGVKKGGEISRDSRDTTSPAISIDRSPREYVRLTIAKAWLRETRIGTKTMTTSLILGNNRMTITPSLLYEKKPRVVSLNLNNF